MYTIVADPNAAPEDAVYTPYGGALEYIYSKEPEVVIAGPSECVGGETRIYDFNAKRSYSIGELCEKNIAPRVQTLFGAKQAGIPFLKGVDRLYRVTLSSGESFVATKMHRVLATDGWKFVGDLAVSEHLLACAPFPPVSSIRYERTDKFYDLAVPGAEHYIAEGAIHHNTGKTLAAMWKLHLIASKYAKAQIVIARAVQADLYGSVVQTFERVIEGAPIEIYGGSRPERYIYPNGSIIWLAGMDKPGKALSSERDVIYVNQAEQLKLDSWEVLTTRTTGRGAVMPYTQTIGDANPAGSRHWILQRKGLKLIKSVHKDNPTLYNRDGTLTKQGERTMTTLQALTGVRRKRLYEGIWATAEGAVYDMFDHDVHVKERDPGEFVRWHLALDEGYTNPAVILLIGEDNDKRWHIEEEWYETGKLQDDVVKQARKMWLQQTKRGTVAVDEAAAGLIAALNNAKLPAVGAKGRILDGIAKIQNRLVAQGDGRPRLTVSAKCVNTINEFESYVWKPEKDVPVDADNHSLGAIRYLEDALGDYGGPLAKTDAAPGRFKDTHEKWTEGKWRKF